MNKKKEEEHRFKIDLEEVLIQYDRGIEPDTPSFILAEYLVDCLRVFDKAVKRRMKWYSFRHAEKIEKNRKNG